MGNSGLHNEFKEYIDNHKKMQQEFIADLKDLLNKHMPMLYEEQFFGVWNKSQLSEVAINKEFIKMMLENFDRGIDMYNALCWISESLGIYIPNDVETPENLR